MLIVVEPGAEHAVLEALMNFEGVVDSSLVYGEFDIHCRLNVKSMKELRKVHDKIRKLKILSSETFIAYERSQRKDKDTKNHHLRRY